MTQKILTQSRLKELLYYDPNTGVFTRKVYRSSNAQIGGVAGGVHAIKHNKKSYQMIGIDKKIYKTARLAWLYMTGSWPKNQIDHEDQNSLNDKFINLRDVTNQENHKNIKIYSSNTSGITGVYWDKQRQKWEAKICVNYKMLHLGRFSNKKDAIAAREAAAKKYGFHDNHGKKN